MKFIEELLGKIERVSYDTFQNYIHTHDRVWYDEKQNLLRIEEICLNEYGSSYFRNVGNIYFLTESEVKNLPEVLTSGDNWYDFPAVC